MLDIVLVIVVLVMTAITLLYAAGCSALWMADTTRDASTDELSGAPKK